MSTPVVAAFDVDGTLTTRDCVVPFLLRIGRRPVVAARVVRRAPSFVVAGLRRDRDRLKELATECVVAGLRADELAREAAAFAALVVRERLRDDTIARLRWHRRQGHRVVFVSASYALYLHHVAAALDAEAVLATELEIEPDGICTGRLAGGNCRGAEKARRLGEWLAGNDLGAVTLWAYGDSAGDRELLALADHAVWVTEPLASVAPIS